MKTQEDAGTRRWVPALRSALWWSGGLGKLDPREVLLQDSQAPLDGGVVGQAGHMGRRFSGPFVCIFVPLLLLRVLCVFQVL